MDITERISFLDVDNIPAELLNFTYVVGMEYDYDVEEYKVVYSDGSTKVLPTTDSPPPETIQDVTISNDVVSIVMENSTLLIDDLYDVIGYDLPEPYGTGLHVGDGVYKPWVPMNTSIQIYERATDVLFRYQDIATLKYFQSNVGQVNFDRMYIGQLTGNLSVDVDGVSGMTVDGSSLLTIVPDYDFSISSPFWYEVTFPDEMLNTLGLSNGSLSNIPGGNYHIEVALAVGNLKSMDLRLVEVNTDEVLLDAPGLRTENVHSQTTGQVLMSGEFQVPDNGGVRFEVRAVSEAATNSVLGYTVTGFTSQHLAGTMVLKYLGKYDAVEPSAMVMEGDLKTALRNITTDALPVAVTTNVDGYDPTQWSLGFNGVAFAKTITSVDGNIYFIPSKATDILKWNPETGTMENLVVPAEYVWNYDGYTDAVLALDGKIYLAPDSRDEFLVIDTVTDEVSSLGASSSSSGYGWVVYSELVHALYYLPQFGSSVVKYDISLGSFETLSIPDFAGKCIVDPATGLIIGVNDTAVEYFSFNPVDNSFELRAKDFLAVNRTYPVDDLYINAHGLIAASPGKLPYFSYINPKTLSVSQRTHSLPQQTAKWANGQGVYGADGSRWYAYVDDGDVVGISDTHSKAKILQVGSLSVAAIANDKYGNVYLFSAEDSTVIKLHFDNDVELNPIIYAV